MRKVLALTAVLMILGSFAFAQTPNVQMVFDEGYSTQTKVCAFGEIFQGYLVARNFNCWMQAIEYNVQYPAGLNKLGELYPVGTLQIGAATDDYLLGFAEVWTVPQNAFQPVLTATVNFFCVDCIPDSPIVVIPNTISGFLRATDYPANNFIYGVGMTSIMCPVTIPTENMTWGGVKALYE
jgi:hypothetical protein